MSSWECSVLPGPWVDLKRALSGNRLVWAVSTEILFEYEEVSARELGVSASGQLLRFIDLLEVTRGNVLRVSPDFRFNIISADPDDNKFTDCAVVAKANYVIREDRHFAPLDTTGYEPKPIKPDEFIARFL